MTQHLARFTQEVMRETSPLSPGLREFIAAYISYVKECEFCTKARVAVAALIEKAYKTKSARRLELHRRHSSIRFATSPVHPV